MALHLVFCLVLLVGKVRSQPEFYPRDQTIPECYRKIIDLFIVLDSSTSIYINDYRQELQFARDFVSRLDISQSYTRVGLLTFSDDITRPPLELNRFQTKGDLLASITEQNLPYRTGVTNTDTAIRYIRENTLFRPDITKIIVVLTDGGSRSPGNTAREAESAREQGFYLYVIGVGQYQDEREWRNIANDPDESFMFNVTFRGLDQVLVALPPRACVLPPLITVATCSVQRSTELYFVAGPGGIQNAVQIIDRFVEATQSTANYVRASFLMSICNAAENVPLGSLNTYCVRWQYPGVANSNTYVQYLSRLRTISQQSRNRNAKQVAILILDEESLRLNRTGVVSEARSVEQVEDIDIIAIDLGTQGYASIIRGITSSSENIITFAPGPVAAQRAVLNNLINRACVVINGGGDDFDFRVTAA